MPATQGLARRERVTFPFLSRSLLSLSLQPDPEQSALSDRSWHTDVGKCLDLRGFYCPHGRANTALSNVVATSHM